MREQMVEYVKKADVLEIINSTLPRDLTAEYIYELKGVWLDEDEADTPQTAQKVAKLQKMCGIEIDPDRIRQTDCGWK